jgi:Zn-dependent protease with chaperone function
MLGNWFKTGLLMAAIMALFGVDGAAIGGGQGMLVALLFGLGTNLWAYRFSDAMVLRLYNAREVAIAAAPRFQATRARSPMRWRKWTATRRACRCRRPTSIRLLRK